MDSGVKILKIIGIVISVFIITVIAQNLGILWHVFKWHRIESILHAITYIIAAYLLIKLFITKVLNDKLSNYNIKPFRFYPSMFMLGILIPTLTIAIYILFVDGHFEMPNYTHNESMYTTIIDTVFISSIAAPIVEELTIRGVMVSYIAKKFNMFVAVIIPSLLFASLHLFNGMLSGTSLLLLIIGGTLAGILYSLAMLTFNNIWASIYLHMIWNLFGLITISTHNEGIGVLQYTIKPNNIALTGGEYGMDASIISIGAYILGIIILGIMLYKKKTSATCSKYV
ncbi:CPBP family intramembrane glutamic endopeptidase [Staphylococcus pettenkoferi]|uniref:CPBP family intramembrane glutamic endopeptidase n=1 Tax=Staphylococcus pettenkoferi TaxID=170573 RepID=UPI001F5ABD12|nr:type II CAAX endopeptidase family protein [Staphylococcus pettenkoferi]MCI2802817.1 CPBP family intramembrane metalloprotease [Staphylococcus pettenkoferi]